MPIHIKIRNFTGTCVPLEVDSKKTVSDVKDLIAARGKGKSARVPTLSFKGHELRDTRQLEYYDIRSGDTIHILPPSKVAKVTLHCKKEDGGCFNLSVNPDTKVAQLKREICIEEKIAAKQLKVISTQEDSDGNEVITLKELNDDDVLSALSLQDEVLTVYTPISGPSEFDILLSIDDRLEDVQTNIFGIAVKSDQTLDKFREELLDKHAISLYDYTLILIGRELKDDRKTLGDLGFISGCTIHAVATVQFCVITPSDDEFNIAASPTTRISAVRKMLEEVDTETNYEKYSFSLNGLTDLKESRTLWDLDIKSGTIVLLIQRCLTDVTIRCTHCGMPGD